MNRCPPVPSPAPASCDRSLCARQERGARRCQGAQAVLQRDAARPEPEGGRGLPALAGTSRDSILTVPRRALRDGDRGEIRSRRRPASSAAPAPTSCCAHHHAYLGPGDEGIFTEHGFLVYPHRHPGGRRHARRGPRRRAHAPTSTRMLAKVTARTKVVFLANPNNPTGTYLPFDEVKRLHAGLPPHVLLVLDAAYAEYVRRNDYASGLELVATTDNVVMTRTFSKIYGLAALAPRLVLRPGPCDRRAQPHPRPLQRQRRRRSRPASRRSRDDGAHGGAVAHNDRWLAVAHARDRGSG